ncbi:hypothetical protein A2Y99_05255 [Candidatus Gottesmanbacteria bacterium RBG_13_37_7]|uniref:AlgX/AlgJ SGNH hydrolase-like domain-containing protein n=1 Tax=Candidatus Gottesmanbacteria bacterium RBG_13_37_7 TaxID=1798369 RepID=A0A1F5YK93_9BACT|nr:MAG: hypothetical protein A2Y99_05255 [Candidatus Gottesmanbacteria bacterium RBG_13_37_7]
MLKICTKISFVFLICLILSLGVDYLYRCTYQENYQLPKNILLHPEIDDKYEIVKVGNSHAEDGLTFERYKLKSLSLASVAQSFEYDLAMLKMYTRQIKKGGIIIINISPLSFSQKKPRKEDNVNMNFYDGRLSPFLIPHLKAAEYLQIQIVPFVRTGFLWREKYAKEVAEKAMNTYAAEWDRKKKVVELVPETNITDKVPIAGVHTFIPTFKVQEIQAELDAPPDLTEKRFLESTRLMVDKWYKSGDFGIEYFEDNTKDLKNLISYCLKNKWQPVLITLPISQVLLDGLGPKYLQNYIYDNVANLDLHNVKYFDFASDTRLTKNGYLFENSDHLNRKGAIIVSYLLLKNLDDANYVSKETDRYDYE